MSDTKLRLSNVTKTFPVAGGSFTALDGVSLEVQSGEVVAILGPSGAGKTTLLTIAGALRRPTSGVVEVAGEEIQGLSQVELARVRREKVGFIFQSFNLFQALTALENVQYVLELHGLRGRHARARAQQVLTMLGMEKRLHQRPKDLSGGEQQRIAVARAFASGGELILADEPTANLDRERSIGLMELLRALSRDLGPPILMVTHDNRVQHLVDRSFWLEGGHLKGVEPGQRQDY
jgi:putative ABC transport system ATP-binding protein